MSESLHQTVCEILSSKANVPMEKLSSETALGDLDIASLDFIETIFAVEDKFNIEIPYNAQELSERVKTVGDIVSALEEALAEKAADQNA